MVGEGGGGDGVSQKSTQTDADTTPGLKDETKKFEDVKADHTDVGGGDAATVSEKEPKDDVADSDIAVKCQCEAKYTAMFEETRERLERESILEKEKALQDLENRVNALLNIC